jgi:hypothetical protein
MLKRCSGVLVSKSADCSEEFSSYGLVISEKQELLCNYFGKETSVIIGVVRQKSRIWLNLTNVIKLVQFYQKKGIFGDFRQ